jgi:hypothetical protein
MLMLISATVASIFFYGTVVSYDDNFENEKTLKEFCQKHMNLTIQPQKQPILCPNLAAAGLKNTQYYICEQLISNISIHHHLQQKEYIHTKLYWGDLFTKLINHLSTGKVMFAGDSLTVNTYFHLKCLAEFAHIDIPQVIIEDKPSPYPSHFNSTLYGFSNNSRIRSAVTSADHEPWYIYIIQNPSVKYLILNTGMWWNNDFILDLKTNSTITSNAELLKAFKIYFRSDGPLLIRLNDLVHTYNVTVFWRDTSPAGSCTHNLWPYQEAFSAMNEIAQQALKKVGAFVIPHIWNESLPYWRIHPERKQDFAHYCIFQNQSVHTLWSTNIIDAILEH